MAASAIVGASGFGNWGKLSAQQLLTQDQLLDFETFGNVSLIHLTDLHADRYRLSGQKSPNGQPYGKLATNGFRR